MRALTFEPTLVVSAIFELTCGSRSAWSALFHSTSGKPIVELALGLQIPEPGVPQAGPQLIASTANDI
jgi:hypothetical protein